MVVVINLVLGLLSPPVGLCFFVAAAVTGAKPGKMFMVTLPFFVISCVLLVLLSLYPSLSLDPHQVGPILIKEPPTMPHFTPPLPRRQSAAASVFAPSLALAQAKELRLGLITPNGHSWNKAALKFGDRAQGRRPTAASP